MLDKAEWVLFQNPTKDETLKNTVLDMALKNVDSNGDGKLQKDEFLNDWREKVITTVLGINLIFIRNLARKFVRR